MEKEIGKTLLPYSVFSTDQVAPDDRWEIWRDSISVMFDVTPEPDPDAPPLFASVAAHHLGSLVFGDTRYTPQAFQRSARKIRGDGIDHYLVQLYPEGGYVGVAGNRDVTMRAGDICLLDLGQTLSTHTSTSRTHTLVIPRELLEAVLPDASSLHGVVLRRESAMGCLLASHLTSLCQHLPTVALDEAAPVSDAVLSMVAACFRPSMNTLRQARAEVGLAAHSTIAKYIESRLGDRHLGPETVAAAFGLSRTSLYRLFEARGGVGAYIQSRRLQRAWSLLIQPAHRHRCIYEIAQDCGFSGEAHFSRSFRRNFGLSPSDVRAQADNGSPLTAGYAVAGTSEGNYAGDYSDWLAQLALQKQA